MLLVSDLLEAARMLRPVLPTLFDAETAQQVDQQLAELLNQPESDNKVTAQKIRALLQSYPATQSWLAEFSTTISLQKSDPPPGNPSLQSAIRYVCPVCDGSSWYREVNEEIPLCPTHLVPLVPAQP